MTRRAFSDARENPLAGDVVEIRECRMDEAGKFDWETMLRVLAVKEDFVWFKEYGAGRKTTHINGWRERLRAAQVGTLVGGSD